jgi:HD-like signal output (HDOD) protein
MSIGPDRRVQDDPSGPIAKPHRTPVAAIEQFFANSSRLPAMPEVTRRLLAGFNDPSTDLRALVESIALDPTLSAKVLRLANTARCSPSRRVATLPDAAALLGTDSLRTLALCVSVAASFPRIPRLDRLAFWKHSLACGGYARWLAQELKIEAESAFFAGFVLRTGQVLLALSLPQLVADIEESVRAPGMRTAIEYARLGCTHQDITCELARRWNFPGSLLAAYASAAQPLLAVPFVPLAGVLCLATLMAEAGSMGLPPLQAALEAEPAVAAALGLPCDGPINAAPTFAALTGAVDVLTQR